MHRLHDIRVDQPIADVRLIGDHDRQEAVGAQCTNRFARSRQKAKILQSPRRIRFSVAHRGANQNAVAVEEDGRPPRVRTRNGGICCHPSVGWSGDITGHLELGPGRDLFGIAKTVLLENLVDRAELQNVALLHEGGPIAHAFDHGL